MAATVSAREKQDGYTRAGKRLPETPIISSVKNRPSACNMKSDAVKKGYGYRKTIKKQADRSFYLAPHGQFLFFLLRDENLGHIRQEKSR